MRIIEFPQDYLLNPQRFVYDAANIRTVLNNLLPFTPIILFGSPLFKPNATFLDTSSSPFPAASYPLPLTEPIYGTRYNKMNIASQLSKYWSTNKPNLRLAVPGKNQYIPKDLSLLPVTSGDTPIKVVESEQPLHYYASTSCVLCKVTYKLLNILRVEKFGDQGFF